MNQLANGSIPYITTPTRADPESGLSLGDIGRTLLAHIWFILLCSLVGLALATVYVMHLKPVYEASATLRIDPSRAGSLGFNDLVPAPNGDPSDAIHTESAVIKSDAVALRTLNSLDDADFSRYTGLTRGDLALDQKTVVFSPKAQDTLTRFRSQLGVKQQETTQLVDITFRNTDPRLAAVIDNAVVSAYIQQNYASRDQSAVQLRTWLSAQLRQLSDQVDRSQRKLAAFQQANNILGTDNQSNTTTDRLKLLNDALTSSQANRIAKEAEMRAAVTGDAAALAARFPNPRLTALQAEQGTLYAQYAQLSAKFGPRYTPLAELQRQMQVIAAEINTEAQSVRERLKQEYAAARQNESMLQSEYDQQKQLSYAFNRNQAEYTVLQADVTSSRELYDTLQRKLQGVDVDALINGVNTTVVSSAHASPRPVEPKKSVTMLSGLVLGLFAGVAAAFLFDGKKAKLDNVDQMERVTGFRVLAMIPRPSGERKLFGRTEQRGAISALALQHPGSQAAEAYRALRNALVPFGSEGGKTFLLASALPEEGLADVTTNLALTLAQSGPRVLVVDTDLRRPSLHTAFGLENQAGLGDLLSAADSARPLLQPFPGQHNLCVLVAGAKPDLPAERLNSQRFRSLLSEWEKAFDFVILQTAPLLLVSDGLPLAHVADLTVLVSSYNSTEQEKFATLHRLLLQSEARVAGLVIDNVPQSVGVYGQYAALGEGYYA